MASPTFMYIWMFITVITLVTILTSYLYTSSLPSIEVVGYSGLDVLVLQSQVSDLNSVSSSNHTSAVSQTFWVYKGNISSAPPRQTIGLNYHPNLVEKFKLPRYNSWRVPRRIGAADYTVLMRLVEKATKVLAEHNITAVLTYGSLIGSYMMHDMLPWDDDVDMFVHNDTKARVIAIFQDGRHHGIRCHHHTKVPGMMVKLFFENSPKAGKYEWNYPFVDIVTYIHEENAVVAVDKGGKWGAPLETFYPLQLRPFGPLWLYAPKHPEVFLTSKYGSFACESSTWNHKWEVHTNRKRTHCSHLSSYYPFVRRTRLGLNYTKETLVLNYKAYYEVIFNNTYEIKDSPYEC